MDSDFRGGLAIKRIALLLILALTATTAICIAVYPRASAPEKALTQMLDNLRDGRLAKAEARTTSGLGFAYDTRSARQLLKAMLKTMRYTVADCSVEGETAQIVVSITMVDMDALLNDLAVVLLDDSLTGTRSTDRKLHRELIARIKAGEEATLTSTVTAQLRLTSDGWRVDVAESKGLLSAITGDLY